MTSARWAKGERSARSTLLPKVHVIVLNEALWFGIGICC
jgi:hypothetical protein